MPQMKPGKCPGDCPTMDEARAPQPKTQQKIPASKNFDITSMWKTATKQGSTQGSKALADRRDQASKLREELE